MDSKMKASRYSAIFRSLILHPHSFHIHICIIKSTDYNKLKKKKNRKDSLARNSIGKTVQDAWETEKQGNKGPNKNNTAKKEKRDGCIKISLKN